MNKIVFPQHLIPGQTEEDERGIKIRKAVLTETQKSLLEELNRKMETLKRLSESE
jgi:hypothetical protein